MSKTQSKPIDILNLSKSYGPVKALDDVSLNISAGEFLTLLGPSGSGKTTLLMALAGFVRPDSGSIKFGEQEMIATAPQKRGLGMVFQSYALFPFMTVAENVAYPLRVRGVSKVDQKTRAERALDTVQLGGYGDRRISQLSGGQRQAVAIARATAFNAKIVIMDEPTAALAVKEVGKVLDLILNLKNLGVSVIVISHRMDDIFSVCDRVMALFQGTNFAESLLKDTSRDEVIGWIMGKKD